MNVALITLALVFGPFGLLLLYAAVFHRGRFSSRYERVWVVVSGAGYAAVAAAFAAAATASSNTRTTLLIAGGLSGIAATVGRIIVVHVSRRS